jgi:hypothetical protein
MPSRGVLYIIWGEPVDNVLERSINSLKKYHPDLPVHIERIPNVTDPMLGFVEKARMAEVSPFEETLFLDVDTVVLGNLDFAFKKAIDFGLACCICENPWARRNTKAGLYGDIIEYNSGVLFFTKKAKYIFDTWKKYSLTIDSSIPFINPQTKEISSQPCSDQASLAKSIEEHQFSPFVLPFNWNFRPIWQKSFFGPVKIWHDYADVPQTLIDSNAYYENPGSIIQYMDLKMIPKN